MSATNVELRQSIPRLPRTSVRGDSDFSRRSACRAAQRRRRILRWISVLSIFAFALTPPASAQTIVFSPYLGPGPAGLFFAAGTANFGNVDALGITSPSAGLSKTAISSGELYQTPYVITVAGTPAGRTTVVKAYVLTNSNPAILQAVSFYPGSSPCPTTGYTTLPSSQATEVDVIAIPGVGDGTQTSCIGLIVNVANGASAVAGTYSVTISFDVFNYQASNGKLRSSSSSTLTINVTVLSAVRLLLGQSGSFQITATGGTPDFTTNFGNVNALGIGPGAGLSTLAAAGGIVYWTPYLIKPTFSGFASTNGTVQVYVSTNFAHPTVLTLDDAAAGTGPFAAISTSSGSQTQITSTASTGASITRYLGLFVSNKNGVGSYRGNDSATLTYTLTVP